MIKQEWITAGNGFKVGGLCLYVDPRRHDMSFAFRLAKLETKVVKHPASGDRDYLYLEGQSLVNNGYTQPVYCEFDGDLYPIESEQWAYWNTGCPENGQYQCAQVTDPSYSGRKTVEYYPSLSGVEMHGNTLVIDRPLWAPGFKL